LVRPVRAEKVEAWAAGMFHQRGTVPSPGEMALQGELYPPKVTNLYHREGATLSLEEMALRVEHFPPKAETGLGGADSAAGT